MASGSPIRASSGAWPRARPERNDHGPRAHPAKALPGPRLDARLPGRRTDADGSEPGSGPLGLALPPVLLQPAVRPAGPDRRLAEPAAFAESQFSRSTFPRPPGMVGAGLFLLALEGIVVITRLSHATVYVLDQDEALKFYRDKL